jgi:hypothetical protein
LRDECLDSLQIAIATSGKQLGYFARPILDAFFR